MRVQFMSGSTEKCIILSRSSFGLAALLEEIQRNAAVGREVYASPLLADSQFC